MRLCRSRRESINSGLWGLVGEESWDRKWFQRYLVQKPGVVLGGICGLVEASGGWTRTWDDR